MSSAFRQAIAHSYTFCVVALLLICVHLRGDLNDGQVHPHSAAPHVVQLHRLRDQQSNEISYVGRIAIGNPRSTEVTVSFGTASDHTVLTPTECTGHGCLDHNRILPSASASPIIMDEDGMKVAQGRPYQANFVAAQSSFEQGAANVTGELYYETLCLGDGAGRLMRSSGASQLCAAMGVALIGAGNRSDAPFYHKPLMRSHKFSRPHAAPGTAANFTNTSDTPTRRMPHNGVVGLGLESRSMTPLLNFLGRLYHEGSGLKQEFGMFFGRHGGEITFGGHSPEHLASPLSWAPVFKPEQGHWQIAIRSIRVGNHTLDACKHDGCRGIVDSASPNLQAPAFLTNEIEALTRLNHDTCIGPDIHFDLDDGTSLTLRAKDYTGRACKPKMVLLPTAQQTDDLIILGLPFLQRYYTVFDVSQKRISFGIAADTQPQPQATGKFMRSARMMRERDELISDDDLVLELDNGVDSLCGQFLRNVAQCCSLAMFALLIVNRQKWSARFLAAARGMQFDVSDLPMVPHDEAPQGDDCVICLGCFEEGNGGSSTDCGCWRRLPCGHKFHEACIFEWLRKSDQCPVCRAKIGLQRGDRRHR